MLHGMLLLLASLVSGSREGDAEELLWLADWDGEQGIKSQHRENGSDGQ